MVSDYENKEKKFIKERQIMMVTSVEQCKLIHTNLPKYSKTIFKRKKRAHSLKKAKTRQRKRKAIESQRRTNQLRVQKVLGLVKMQSQKAARRIVLDGH